MKRNANGEPFRLLREFEIVIPDSYLHGKRLHDFTQRASKQFYFLNPEITDKNFEGASNELKPGERFAVKMFSVDQTQAGAECVAFIKSEGGILVGTQGASLVWELNQRKLPKGKWIVSLDEESSLLKDGDDSRVPMIYRFVGEGARFDLGSFDGGFGSDCVIIGFWKK